MDKPRLPKVLIADDNYASRLSLRLELEDADFEVVEAEDGTGALELLAGQPFDAVVTDIWMPGHDGVEIVKAIARTQPETVIFAITGGGPGMTIASASTLAKVWGAAMVYVKPFDVRDLVTELRARVRA
ncbi:MAG TPA: response regulator [Devosia sp.]|nr:response regulator [Devosia sp.]